MKIVNLNVLIPNQFIQYGNIKNFDQETSRVFFHN